MYLKSLDGIKGICACIIAFTFHYYCSFNVEPLKKVLFLAYDYGKYCVETFFFLSGFVLFLHYSNKVNISFDKFLSKRLRRLYPMYLLTTLVTALLIYLSLICTRNFTIWNVENGGGSNTISQLIIHILLLGSGWMENTQAFNSPLWYICILVICYIIFFFIEKKIKINDRIYAYIVWGLLGLWIVYNNPYPYIPLLGYDNGRGYLSFSLGCIWCYYYKRGILDKYKNVIIYAYGSALLSILALVGVFGRGVLGDILIVIAFVINPSIVILCIYSKNVRVLLESKIFQFLGKNSLALYLWHCPIFVAINLVNYIFNLRLEFMDKKIYFIICSITFCISIILNELSTHWIEGKKEYNK